MIMLKAKNTLLKLEMNLTKERGRRQLGINGLTSEGVELKLSDFPFLILNQVLFFKHNDPLDLLSWQPFSLKLIAFK